MDETNVARGSKAQRCQTRTAEAQRTDNLAAPELVNTARNTSLQTTIDFSAVRKPDEMSARKQRVGISARLTDFLHNLGR